MKIAFYGQPLLNQNKTGIAYYEDGLLKGLVRDNTDEDWGLDIFTISNNGASEQCREKYGNRLSVCECRWISERLYKLISLVLPLPYHLFFKEKRDITHFCNYVIPYGVKGKKVVTVHDLAFREYPETVRGRTKLMLKTNLKRSLKSADAIVVDSEFTKSEIIKYYNVSEADIDVVPCGVDTSCYFPETYENIMSVKQKYGIQDEYFCYLGTLEPRKNIAGLLAAYKLFMDKSGSRTGENVPKLVIAGGKGWMYEGIFQKIAELSLEEDVIFTGYVAEEEKNALMSGAMIFCFPSFYEGFGMPPLEAMACGVPVLTSNTSSLAEVTGEAAYQVDPYDLERMSDAMVELYHDRNLRNDFIQKGFEQVKKYSWERAVGILRQVYARLQEA